uniref:Peptidase S54 rhomboid domain-containing protein n=1 Tax=Physcomitrium patens TaxID=3218 RepID=A0A2K1ICN1_PHYPA|nr:hypothetical protein PHYPA_030516 [Physcomitrium patens]
MNAGVSGFKNAIVTKGIVVTCGLVSLVLAARGDAKAYNLSYQKIAQRLELWRLVVSPLVFTSLPELLFGLYLLYFFRVFERQAGSIKYLFFVFFTTSVSTFLELVFLFTLKDSSFISSIRLNSGPTGLIFSSFVLFFFDVPVSIRFKLLGIKVSEKSFVYLIGLQLLLWSRMHSMIPGICGIIAGFIYRCDLGGIQEIGFSSGAFRRMAWRVSPFFSGISSEMASRMNNNRASEPVNEPTNRPQENKFCNSNLQDLLQTVTCI